MPLSILAIILQAGPEKPPILYNMAATPAARAPKNINPFETVDEAAPVCVEVAADPVELAVDDCVAVDDCEDDPALDELLPLSEMAPKVPPWTVAGVEA